MSTQQTTNLPIVPPSTSTNTTKTLRLFNGYFDTKVTVDINVYDVVHGFFVRKIKSQEAADALTAAVITTSFDNKLDPLQVIKDLDSVDDLELDATLALYMNETRRNTSLLGVKQTQPVIEIVARSILA